MSWRALLLLPWVWVVSCPAMAGDIPHVARPGDTPVALSKSYHVSVAAIMARNKGLDPCRIKVGDVIYVPAPPPDVPFAPPAAPAGGPSDRNAVLPDEEITDARYVVVPGDCPEAIARRFGITVEILARANPGLETRNLAIGRVLAIPTGGTCPPPVPVTRPGEPAPSAPLVMDFQ